MARGDAGSFVRPGVAPLTRRIGDTEWYPFAAKATSRCVPLGIEYAGGMTAEVSPEACRAARAILQWSAKDLCREASVSPNTVGRLESGAGIGPEPSARIAQAFTDQGIELLAEGKPGARLARSPSQ